MSRWTILAILFTARLTMGFQYQAVAAVGPLYATALGIGYADLGLLIGLYLLPGLVFAIPGGGLAARFGDKRTVAWGMGFMVIGAILIWAVPSWEAQEAGRLLAGLGGVLLNVLMSKMVQDWFAQREIATAMGIYVNSWPVGIALALVILPPLAGVAGLTAVSAAVFVVTAVGFSVFLVGYRSPDAVAQSASMARWPRGDALLALISAALIWGCYNAALAVVFSFGPLILVGQGLTPSQASGATSLVLWFAVLSIPMGGLVEDRMGRPGTVLLTGLLGFTVALVAALYAPGSWLVYAGMGFALGLSAGPIMALPSRVLAPAERGRGMGLFFAIYYAAMVIGPFLAGLWAEGADDPRAAYRLGLIALGLGLSCVVAYRAAARRVTARRV